VLRGWEPALLAERVAETASWWVEQMRSEFEDKAAQQVAAAGGEGARRLRRRREAQGDGVRGDGARDAVQRDI
jgi:hypothetical protein